MAAQPASLPTAHRFGAPLYVKDGDEAVILDGRIAEIIRELIKWRERITDIGQGHVRFDVGLGTVKSGWFWSAEKRSSKHDAPPAQG